MSAGGARTATVAGTEVAAADGVDPPAPLEPDLDEAQRFLELLDEPDAKFTFQVIPEGDNPSAHPAIFHGTFEQEAGRLVAQHRRGCAVFVMVNEGDGGGRRAENVTCVRAVFCDSDGSPLQPVQACALDPHEIVESSPGRYHAYWRVDGLPLDQFAGVQRAIAQRFGGDPAVCDPPRVMRLPGFWHRKGAPFLTRIVEDSARRPYSAAEILAEFPPAAAGNGAVGHEHGTGEGTAELIRRITTGESYHPSLLALAFRLANDGIPGGTIVECLRGFMNASTRPRDDRWRARYASIPSLVTSAQAKVGQDEALEAEPDDAPDYFKQGGFVLVRRTSHDPSEKVCHPGCYRVKMEKVQDEDGNKTYDVETWSWFASPIEVLANTRNGASEDWGRLLIIHDPDGIKHEWPMPMSLLAARGDEFRAKLLNLGAQIAPSSFGRNSVAEYVQLWRPGKRARCVDRVGWHGRVFVLPDRTSGRVNGERTILQVPGTVPQFDQAGTLEDWQAQIAEPAVGNSRLTFALSIAFAGPLIHLLGEESGGFHFSGRSSTGKTTALRVAASVWGQPHDSWRATDNAAEGMARGACDSLLCLDEISQADGRAVDAIAYMIGNGRGKQRMRRDATARLVISWRVMLLSTGEKGLADKLAEAGRRAQAGQAVRVIEVPADAGAGLGIFEDLHGHRDGDAFARHLRLASDAHKGTAGRAYADALAGDLDPIASMVAQARNAWCERAMPKDSDGQVRRVAGRFGLVAAAGELAVALGIAPWPAGEADRAATVCFNAWLNQRGGTGPAEIRDGIAQVRAFIEAHGTSRFEPAWIGVDSHQRADEETIDHLRKTINRAGFRRDDGEGRWIYCVFPEAWRREVCKGFDPTLIARAMADAGWLEREGKNLTRYVRIPGVGKRVRLYVITADFLENDQ